MWSFMSTYKNCIRFGKSQNLSYHGFPVLITSAPFLFPPFPFQRSISRPLFHWEDTNSSVHHSQPKEKRMQWCLPFSAPKGTELGAGKAQVLQQLVNPRPPCLPWKAVMWLSKSKCQGCLPSLGKDMFILPCTLGSSLQDRLVSRACYDRTGNHGFTLKESRFRLYI